jgi:hypothetical protein
MDDCCPTPMNHIASKARTSSNRENRSRCRSWVRAMSKPRDFKSGGIGVVVDIQHHVAMRDHSDTVDGEFIRLDVVQHREKLGRIHALFFWRRRAPALRRPVGFCILGDCKCRQRSVPTTSTTGTIYCIVLKNRRSTESSCNVFRLDERKIPWAITRANWWSLFFFIS